jgi:2-C-methyl-D-erythritol 4-phosphate cytidylyltransferase
MVSAIVLAAGAGKRLKSAVSKPLIKIGNRAAIIYSLQVLSKHPDIDEIIVVVSASNQKLIRKTVESCFFKKIKNFVLGGNRRQDSVYNGLKAVSFKSDFILIHDAARPFIDNRLVTRVIQAAKRSGAAILGVPVKATIKRIKENGRVDKTLDRNNLWEIQTPQVFKKELILKAYKKFLKDNVTDDAALIEKLGKVVKIVLGSYKNIKITTYDDLMFAQAICRSKS